MNEVSSMVENYDRGTVIYDIYFQQKSLWPILLFSSWKLAELRRLYSYSQNLGLTYKHQETSVNKCHEHILLITSTLYICKSVIFFITDLQIFLFIDIHSLMMLWRTFEEIIQIGLCCAIWTISKCVYFLVILAQTTSCNVILSCYTDVCKLKR